LFFRAGDGIRDFHVTGVQTCALPISPQVASQLLAERVEPGAKVLVVGGPSLAEQIRTVGLEPVDKDGADVVAVVQGWSPDLNWQIGRASCSEGGLGSVVEVIVRIKYT